MNRPKTYSRSEPLHTLLDRAAAFTIEPNNGYDIRVQIGQETLWLKGDDALAIAQVKRAIASTIAQVFTILAKQAEQDADRLY